jgi:hypothetical protein
MLVAASVKLSLPSITAAATSSVAAFIAATRAALASTFDRACAARIAPRGVVRGFGFVVIVLSSLHVRCVVRPRSGRYAVAGWKALFHGDCLHYRFSGYIAHVETRTGSDPEVAGPTPKRSNP